MTEFFWTLIAYCYVYRGVNDIFYYVVVLCNELFAKNLNMHYV